MTEVTKYRSFGKEFDSREECLAYESAMMDLYAAVVKISDQCRCSENCNECPFDAWREDEECLLYFDSPETWRFLFEDKYEDDLIEKVAKDEES